MYFMQTLIKNLFSTLQKDKSDSTNRAYIKNQHSKKEFFDTQKPKLISTENLAKYFNLSTEDILDIMITFPSPWIEKISRGYQPTKEGYKHGAREAYDKYESSVLWHESILFNEELIQRINIVINKEVYSSDTPTKKSFSYQYAKPA